MTYFLFQSYQQVIFILFLDTQKEKMMIFFSNLIRKLQTKSFYVWNFTCTRFCGLVFVLSTSKSPKKGLEKVSDPWFWISCRAHAPWPVTSPKSSINQWFRAKFIQKVAILPQKGAFWAQKASILPVFGSFCGIFGCFNQNSVKFR